MFKRLTDTDWEQKGNAHSEVYKRLAIFEDGIERGELVYTTELKSMIIQRIAYCEAKKERCEDELISLRKMLEEIKRNERK